MDSSIDPLTRILSDCLHWIESSYSLVLQSSWHRILEIFEAVWINQTRFELNSHCLYFISLRSDTFMQSELRSKSAFELQEGFVVMVSSMSDVAVPECHKPAGVSWF